MNQKTKNTDLLMALFSCLFLLSLIACKDDDAMSGPSNPTPLTYDAQKHIYATNQVIGEGEWETIIDPATGEFDTVPGTREIAGGLDFPLGARALTDFTSNRRIFIPWNGVELVVQDLATAEKTIIDLTGTQQLQFLNKGKNNNEYYVFNTFDDDILKINLLTETTVLRAESIPLLYYQENDMIYSPEQDDMIFFGQKNDPVTEYGYAIYDFESNAFIGQDTLPQLFGFVKHPSKNSIFCLTNPTDDIGFRLVELTILNDRLALDYVSSADLDIDKLSPTMQTIHTATNSYICKGGDSSFESPETFLYSIDLDSGELLFEVMVENFGFMVNIEAE